MSDDPLSIALDLARALERGGVTYAIGGALARVRRPPSS